MTSPIQPPPDHVILSPEFLRKHGAVSEMKWQHRSWTGTKWHPWSKIRGRKIKSAKYLVNLATEGSFSAPRAIVLAIDPEYVRECDQKQQLTQAPSLTAGQRLTPEREVWLRAKPAHYHVHELWPELEALRAELKELRLTAGPSPGVTVSPEGGEPKYGDPDFKFPTFEIRCCRHCGWQGKYGQSRAELLICPSCNQVTSMIHAVPVRAAMQQEAGQ